MVDALHVRALLLMHSGSGRVKRNYVNYVALCSARGNWHISRGHDVEHSFAHALGIGEGQRNDVNDADYVRSGKLAHLARAISRRLYPG